MAKLSKFSVVIREAEYYDNTWEVKAVNELQAIENALVGEGKHVGSVFVEECDAGSSREEMVQSVKLLKEV